MIEGLIDDLEANRSNIVLSSSCVEITCAHDILSEILVEFSSKVQALSMDKRRSSRPMDSLNPNLLLGGEHASTSSNCISTFKKLYDYYIGNVNTELASVVLLFRQTEALDADILGGFIDLIKSISASFNIRLLFVHSLSRPVRFHLSQSFQSSVSLNLHPIHSIGSGELYDITVGRVLTARDIPVTIPADVVGWIHEGFWRSDRCVSSAIDK